MMLPFRVGPLGRFRRLVALAPVDQDANYKKYGDRCEAGYLAMAC